MRARAPVVLAVLIAALAVGVGLDTGYDEVDVDEVVFRDTLLSMQAGDGYYDAMREALIEKEGAPPSQVRAIRPPTMFLVLRWFPESSWRWLMGVIYLAILLAAWRLGAPYGPFGGVIAVVLAGVWVIGASSFLFLHGELWGLPLFLAGAAWTRRNEAAGATLIAGAALVRELYGLGLLVGLVTGRRRMLWAASSGAVFVLAFVHAALAQRVLEAGGMEAALGNEPLTVSSVLTFLAPGDRPLAWVLGVLMLAAGMAGMARVWSSDPAARILLPFVGVMAPLGVLASRAYWNLTWGAAAAAFAWPGIRLADRHKVR